MNKQSIYFNPREVLAIAMGLGLIIDDFNSTKEMPWNPEARKDQLEILAAVKSAAAKLEKFTGVKCDLPPYIDGEEKDYFTKPS